MKRLLELVVLTLLLGLGSCGGDPETGPGTVRWDKVSCERCIMAVSDHFFSAQVRGGPAEKKTRLYFFDDFGCAVLWLEDQSWQADPRTEIWVNAAKTGEWLDARTAFYLPGCITPMDYGLGAQVGQAPGALDFERAGLEVHTREDRHHLRTADPAKQSNGTD